MAAHKYWKAVALPASTTYPYPLELSEFQLYSGGVRVDQDATLTANATPSSGSLAALKDNLTTATCYWADTSTLPAGVQLSWVFPSPVDIDEVVLGARTTIARFPTSGLLRGSDVADPVSGRITVRGFGNAKFVSATMTPRIPLSGPRLTSPRIGTHKDYSFEGGRGLITDTVKTKGTPADFPTFCKVRLVRDIDGKVIRETWTHSVTGVYRFDYFDESFSYTVIAIHPLGSFRAVIADRITPGLMP